MSSTADALLNLLRSAINQPVELDAEGRVSFLTADDVVVTFEISGEVEPEDEDVPPQPVESFYLVSEVAQLPEDLEQRVDVLTLALAFNRALLVDQFSIAMGNVLEGQPQALLLGYTGSLKTVEEGGLADVLERFSSSAAYLKIELNNLNEE